MKEMIEHYGLGLVELLAVLAVFRIILQCMESSGVLSNLVLNYMYSISG